MTRCPSTPSAWPSAGSRSSWTREARLGSTSIVNELTRHGLIDRYHILLYPLVLGHGKRMFHEGTEAKLQLRESRPLGEGVVALVYEPVAPGTPA